MARPSTLSASLDVLTLDDIADVTSLFERSSAYFVLQDGVAPTSADARDLFADVPPGRSSDDQVVLGWREGGRLVALVAILRDYPERGIWYIGFLIVDPARRGSGVGRAMHSAAERLAAEQGAREIRLAVLVVNDCGRRFWHSLGYKEHRRVGPDRFKGKAHARVELTRMVEHGELAPRAPKLPIH